MQFIDRLDGKTMETTGKRIHKYTITNQDTKATYISLSIDVLVCKPLVTGLCSYFLARAKPILLVPRSYTEYHFLRKASPKMARGPAGSGKSIPNFVSFAVTKGISPRSTNHTKDRRDTRSLNIQNIILWAKGEVVTREREG